MQSTERSHEGEEVKILVDETSIEIHRGSETIVAIKQKAKVPLADQLQLEKPDGSFEKLDQNGSIVIKGGEHFVVFPGSGKSS